jgi:hypothetical protein
LGDGLVDGGVGLWPGLGFGLVDGGIVVPGGWFGLFGSFGCWVGSSGMPG